jgi:phosphotransferase system IIA component
MTTALKTALQRQRGILAGVHIALDRLDLEGELIGSQAEEVERVRELVWAGELLLCNVLVGA